jgi:hypothetical protein
MFTPKGLSVLRRVSRMATRSASGSGCVSAVRMPDGDPCGGRVSLRQKNSGGRADPTETTSVGNRRDERRHPNPVATNSFSRLPRYFNSLWAITIACPLER